MLNIQAASILAFLATSTLVSAHGHVQSWTVNGEKKSGFNPSYAAAYGATAERPTDNSDQGYADWTTGIVACGGKSAGTGLQTWDLDAGSTVTAHWNTWPDSHKGSIAEYMARCPGTSCDGVAADSLDWFKIEETNFADGKWPTETVAKTLDWSFKIPSDLASGPYLVRHDLLAMHTIGAPQVYPVCFQANLVGTGSATPKDTVKFPAAYSINPEFKTWNIYNNDNTAFPPPGPAVYAAGAAGVPALTAPIRDPAASSALATPAAPSSAAPAATSSAAASASSAAPAMSSAAAGNPAPGAPGPAATSSAAVKPPKVCNKRKRDVMNRYAKR